jgi:D-glycero-alpha-D-manno-heptose-7-phosphate kinase
MIISRTPFRVSFFGGGTDYPIWYEENGGRVLSSTINKFCFVTLRILPPFFDYKYYLQYYRRETANSIDEISNPSIRECLKYLNISEGVEVVHHADLPAQSGLGSSSTFTVCLLHAAYALQCKMPTKLQLAIDAIHIEQHIIGEAVGSQDQTAAAFGGINRIEFGGARQVTVTPLILSNQRIAELQDHCMLFFSGFSRKAAKIAADQIALTKEKSTELRCMVEICEEAERIIVSSSESLLEWGRLLKEQWKIKRCMGPKITNGSINDILESGLKAGAIGGKLLGAGGGGFVLFFVEPEKRELIRKALSHLLYVPFGFEFGGSQIVYYANHS